MIPGCTLCMKEFPKQKFLKAKLKASLPFIIIDGEICPSCIISMNAGKATQIVRNHFDKMREELIELLKEGKVK